MLFEFQKNALFSTWLKFVLLGHVIIHICLTAKWMNVGNIGFLSIVNFVGSGIIE